MFYKIFIFLIFLGPLVFFHELGHFLFARLFGVRVEVFSIGFGKKLFSFKKGDTEYRFSLIPLGGFVKMYGDDPTNREGIPEDQRKFAFNHKSIFARFWIVFGGPFANWVMAFAIYFVLIFSGERVPLFKIGELTAKSEIAQYGFQTGDIVSKINGEEVYTVEDVILLGDEINQFTVDRSGEEKVINAEIDGESFLKDLAYNSANLIEALVVNKKGQEFYLSQFRELPKDLVSYQELQERHPSSVYVINKETKEVLSEISIIPTDFDGSLRKQGYFIHDLVIKRTFPKSAAAKAGLKEGDIISKIKGQEVNRFYALRDIIQSNKSEKLAIEIYRDGELKTFELSPEEKKIGKETYYSIGVESSIQLFRPDKIQVPGKSFFSSIEKSVKRTYLATSKTLEGFKNLFVSKASLQSLGGPVAIATVASDSLSVGLAQFFRLMAIISINLAIINLFPIPVLDGGHIVFLVIEFFNRGPLSRRKLEIAQQLGLSLLLLLIFIALYNDVTRYLI
ncbi:MAG: RIP metalloprotease RseP [Halobacteriovoraceae bacterium]|nr:RIP metalloprotease RseP [Halobacteriovoraceae bacterium]